MFSKHYALLDSQIRNILENTRLPQKQRVKEILEKSTKQQVNLLEIAELLEVGKSPDAKQQLCLVKDFIRQRFRNKASNEVRHIAPVYLSSYCIDTCAYCNFSANRKTTRRTRISISQLKNELKSILDSGSKVIEFTLATDPEFTTSKLAEYLSEAKEMLKNEDGSGLILCSDYMSAESYQKLKSVGLWGMVQWDETLDKEQFQRWHGKSQRKSRFEERIDNHDRAMSAGLEVATGILFGLTDFRYDVLMQIAKARYLQEEYGKKPFVFGTARLKPSGGIELNPTTMVNDKAYEIALAAYKIAEPQIPRWLQTRETPEFNFKNMLDDDFVTHACGKVKPGGYSVNAENTGIIKSGQFRVHEMGKQDFENTLDRIGFKINYAWIR